MKDRLISSHVEPFNDLSAKIKEFIHEKKNENQSPFKEETAVVHSRSNKAKRSLTDWRQLYHKNDHKIIPRHTVYPATADGERIRCAMTGQCNRRKIHSSTFEKTALGGERSFVTRQTRRSKWTDFKKDSMIDFAVAQTVYQNDIIKAEADASSTDKKFCKSKVVGHKRDEFAQIGEYISRIENEPISVREKDATQEYINRTNV